MRWNPCASLSRRQLLLAGGAWSAASLVSACSSGPTYDEAVSATWRHASPASSDRAALLRTLVRYATLAPSSHNTQCWRFRVHDQGVQIEPDLTRRCPVVDPDDHHVFVSLGCAAENLAQAAAAHGLEANGAFDPAGTGRYVVSLTSAPSRRTVLFEAIPERQSTRGDYDGRALSAEELRLLAEAGSGPGVRLVLLTERQAMETALEYVVAGNTAQMNDEAFVRELTTWIRFSRSEAVSTGDGLFSGASGNPSVPRWVGRALMGRFFTVESENDRYARQVRNAAGIAVFIGQQAEPAYWVEVGRCYERFALQATALGVRNAFLNQPVEVLAVRPQFASWLGVPDQRPDLVVRFGRGPKMPSSLRRPVGAVLV
jgi:hypothetical protein